MEGSVISRVQSPRAIQFALRETNVRPQRQPRVQNEKSTPFHQVFVSVWRRKWLLLAVAALGGILAGLAGFTRPVLFEATTQVIIDAPARNAVAPGPGSSQDLLDASIDDHLTVLSSEAHLRRVLAAVREPVDDAGTPELREAAEAAELKALKKGMRVGQELRSRVIAIGFTDPDPIRAAKVANAFAQTYIDDLAQKRRESDQRELDSIVARLPDVREELVAATDELETYRLTHGTADQGSADGAAREVAELGRQISLSTADLAAVEMRLQYIKSLQEQGAPPASFAKAIGSPVLNDLIALQAKSDANAKGDLPDAINREIEQATAHLEIEANVYRAQLASLQERKNGLDAVAADSAHQLSGLRALEPRVAIVTQHYNGLLARQQELAGRIAAPAPGVAILSVAWPPSNPKTLSPIFLIPPGMIMIGLLGAILVAVRSRFDHTLRGEAETEEALGIPCLGMLPQVSRIGAKKLRNLLQEQPSGSYSRAVTSLLFAASPTQPKGRLADIFLVTSSSRDDGKSELAWSLALSAVRLGGRVLFLDLARTDTRLTNEFRDEFSSFRADNSFSDYMSGLCASHEAVEEMPDIGIDFMSAPAGDLLPLLSLADGAEYFDQLRTTYSFVVVDAPSGQDGPATMLLAGWADAMLFAVRWGKTQGNTARGALASLGTERPNLAVGSVILQVNARKHASYRFGDAGDLLLSKG